MLIQRPSSGGDCIHCNRPLLHSRLLGLQVPHTARLVTPASCYGCHETPPKRLLCGLHGTDPASRSQRVCPSIEFLRAYTDTSMRLVVGIRSP